MGKRGPKKEPTVLKLLKGNPSRENLDGGEVMPTPALPDCPAWVGVHGAEVWAALAPQLRDLGILASIDQNALASYCRAVNDAKEAAEAIDEEGPIVVTKNGQHNNPAYSRLDKALAKIVSLGNQLGLSAAARVGLKPSGETKQKSTIASFIKGKHGSA